MPMVHSNFVVLMVSIFAIVTHVSPTEAATEDSLGTELAALDAQFFQRGFNECDLEFLEQHVDESLVFYHDQSGVQDVTEFHKNTRQAICSGEGLKPIRKLIPGSLTTFPLYDQGKLYGAIQHGQHMFYLRDEQNNEQFTSAADFTHTWVKRNGQWKLANVLSYNHKSP